MSKGRGICAGIIRPSWILFVIGKAVVPCTNHANGAKEKRNSVQHHGGCDFCLSSAAIILALAPFD
jgi:hypothetical protein